MSRRNWARILRLEQAAQDSTPPAPWLVLMPGEEPPKDYAGDLVRIGVFDGRKQAIQ